MLMWRFWVGCVCLCVDLLDLCLVIGYCGYIFDIFFFFFLMIRRPPRFTLSSSSAASDEYKGQCQVFLTLVT